MEKLAVIRLQEYDLFLMYGRELSPRLRLNFFSILLFFERVQEIGNGVENILWNIVAEI